MASPSGIRLGRVRVRDAVLFGGDTFRTLLVDAGFTLSLVNGHVHARLGDYEERIPDSNIVQYCTLDAYKLWSG